jgi:hypothetical protein
MCVAAYVVAPPPLLPVPALPRATVIKVTEAPSASGEAKDPSKPEAAFAKECEDKGEEGEMSDATEEEAEEDVLVEEDEDDGDPDGGWGGLLTSLARNLLVYGADGEALPPPKLWAPPEPDDGGCGGGDEAKSTSFEVPLPGSPSGGVPVDAAEPVASRRASARAGGAPAAAAGPAGPAAAAAPALAGSSGATSRRAFELPPALRRDVLQRRYVDLAAATGAAASSGDGRNSGSAIRGAGSSSSSSSGTAHEAILHRGTAGGQLGVDPAQPLAGRGLPFAAQCAVLRAVLADARAALPDHPLRAPPHDPILEGAGAARVGAAHDRAGRALARRRRQQLRAVKRARYAALLDSRARRLVALGLGALADLEGLLAAIRWVHTRRGAGKLKTNGSIFFK